MIWRWTGIARRPFSRLLAARNLSLHHRKQEHRMRYIFKVSMPVKKFNSAVRDGSAGRKIKQILEDTKPEAAYFTDENGMRTGILIVDIEKASQIPSIAEPWFLNFNAAISLHPCMTPADLASAGLDELGKKWG